MGGRRKVLGECGVWGLVLKKSLKYLVVRKKVCNFAFTTYNGVAFVI